MPFEFKQKFLMKKMVLSAAVVLALTVASCGNNGTTNNQEQTTETPVETAPVTASGTYTAEPTSVIEWKGSKPTGSHTGTIALQSGTFTVDNGKVSGDFVIDMNSITVTDSKEDEGKLDLEAHLKGRRC